MVSDQGTNQSSAPSVRSNNGAADRCFAARSRAPCARVFLDDVRADRVPTFEHGARYRCAARLVRGMAQTVGSNFVCSMPTRGYPDTLPRFSRERCRFFLLEVAGMARYPVERLCQPDYDRFPSGTLEARQVSSRDPAGAI